MSRPRPATIDARRCRPSSSSLRSTPRRARSRRLDRLVACAGATRSSAHRALASRPPKALLPARPLLRVASEWTQRGSRRPRRARVMRCASSGAAARSPRRPCPGVCTLTGRATTPKPSARRQQSATLASSDPAEVSRGEALGWRRAARPRDDGARCERDAALAVAGWMRSDGRVCSDV